MPVLKPQGQGLFKFCITAVKDSSLYFEQKAIFRLLNGWVKIHQIPYIMFETTSQFFFKICIALQCRER